MMTHFKRYSLQENVSLATNFSDQKLLVTVTTEIATG